jgi:predicted lactoylglutathione lyase
VDAGGSEYRETQDYGWMYGRAFEDIWEPFYMDIKSVPEEMKKRDVSKNQA